MSHNFGRPTPLMLVPPDNIVGDKFITVTFPVVKSTVATPQLSNAPGYGKGNAFGMLTTATYMPFRLASNTYPNWPALPRPTPGAVTFPSGMTFVALPEGR